MKKGSFKYAWYGFISSLLILGAVVAIQKWGGAPGADRPSIADTPVGGADSEQGLPPAPEDQKELEEYFQKLDQLRSQGENDEAIELITAHLAAHPEHWPDYVRLAEFSMMKNEPDKAEGYLKKALAADPSGSYTFRTYADLLMQKKDYKGAREMLDKSLQYSEDEGNKAHTYSVYARYYIETGDVKKASEYAQKALGLLPDNPHFQRLVAMCEENL